MGFSIGSLIGALAPIVGGFFGGAPGLAIGTAVATGFGVGGSPVGRVTAPPPPPPTPTPAIPMTSVVPFVSRAQSGRNQFFGGAGRDIIVRSGGGRGLSRVGQAAKSAGESFTGFFRGGNGGKMSAIAEILAQARETFGAGVTKNKIIDAAKNCGIELTADTFGLSVTQVCTVVVQGRSRRRRGISAADIRRTRRTIRFVNSLRKDLKKVSAR